MRRRNPGRCPVRHRARLGRFDVWLARIQAAPWWRSTLKPIRWTHEGPHCGHEFSDRVGSACYVPLRHEGPDAPDQLPLDEVLPRLKPWLEDASRPKVGQNIKYDTHVLANHGIQMRGYAHDTMLQSYVLEAHRPTA